MSQLKLVPTTFYLFGSNYLATSIRDYEIIFLGLAEHNYPKEL